MKANEMFNGQMVVVANGEFEGLTARVVDASITPDHLANDENRRKVLVEVEMSDGTSHLTYILPRSLRDPNAPVVVPPPAPVVAPAAALTIVKDGSLVQGDPITDPMDPSLDEFRPDPRIVNEYVSRKVVGGLSDVEYMLHLRDQRDGNGYSPNVAMVGETQSGKTMLVRVLAVLAAQRDGMPKPYPIFTLNGSMGITNYDLFGQTSAVIVDGNEALVWMDGLVPRALHCGGFLYLDEWNAVTPAQATALHPVLDDRREFVNYQRAVPDGKGGWRPEVVKAHPSLWVLSTINPGYKGTQSMAEASTNRFRWLPWDYDAAVEASLVPSDTVRLLGSYLRELRAQRLVSVPVGTSALRRLNEDCATFGPENALWVFTAMFPPNERDRVTAVIDDRNIRDLLTAEYPNPKFGPAPETTTV